MNLDDTLSYLKAPNLSDDEKRKKIVKCVNLGLIHSSQAKTIAELFLTRLESEGEVTNEINPNFLVRYWPPAFIAWSTKNVRDAFYQSPQFPRLVDPESIKPTITKGVANGFLAYVGKKGNKYDPFFFNQQLVSTDIEISDDMYILTSEEARKNIEPRKLASIKITPQDVIIEPEKSFSFTAKGYDQYEDEINIDSIVWSTSNGTITDAGVLTVEETEGNYKIVAKSNGITASVIATVKKKDETTKHPPVVPPSPGKTRISWSGQIDKKKWNVFYTKVLAKFASNPNLTITVKFEVEEEGSGGEQKKDETKTALKELGLEDNI